ncbi:MAG: LysR substrate-binding domain-containing protein [Gammaproteobacteria bacterium]
MDKFAAMTTFVQIVEKGSLTAAAQALATSLPSVVRTLATLERDRGVRLLNRTTRRIRLTDEGEQYFQRCRAILAAVQEAEAALASRQEEPQGRLRVTAPVLFGRRYIAPIVNAFVVRYPALIIELLLLDRVVNLIEEGLDAGIRIGQLRDSSLIAIPVGQVRRVVCASPGYLQRHGIPATPHDLREHRCIGFTALAAGGEWRFRSGRREVGVPVRCVLSCNQVDAAMQACVDGVGIGMFLSYQVAPYRAVKKLRYVLEEHEPAALPVHVIYPHVKLRSITVRTFVDACVDSLRQTSLD